MTQPYYTQPITAVDIKEGRIRVPRSTTEALFPRGLTDVDVEVRGERKSCRWNPRDKKRSGVLGIGTELMQQFLPESERLRVWVERDVFYLG